MGVNSLAKRWVDRYRPFVTRKTFVTMIKNLYWSSQSSSMLCPLLFSSDWLKMNYNTPVKCMRFQSHLGQTRLFLRTKIKMGYIFWKKSYQNLKHMHHKAFKKVLTACVNAPLHHGVLLHQQLKAHGIDRSCFKLSTPHFGSKRFNELNIILIQNQQVILYWIVMNATLRSQNNLFS